MRAYLLGVSIPNGSIKRNIFFFCYILHVVSIPNGSIKRHQHLDQYQKYHVSIPNGSIKRQMAWWDTDLLSTFQFLMVQLKVMGFVEDLGMQVFQFLMVQLKV